jgi:hypothetical protein
MPYFVQIGAHTGNKCGVCSRGYHLFRRARTVIARWGAVVVLPGREFRWIYQQERRYVLRSRDVAQIECRKMAAKRSATYSRLPKGVSIR